MSKKWNSFPEKLRRKSDKCQIDFVGNGVVTVTFFKMLKSGRMVETPL